MRYRTALATAAALLATTFAPVLDTAVTAATPGASTFAYAAKKAPEGGACTLVKVDLATAVVTDYPDAIPSEAACVNDLAVAPDGTPWGIVELPQNIALPTAESTPQAVVLYAARLVRFDPETGAVVDTVVISYNEGVVTLESGGIAVTASGVYVQAVTPQCNSGSSVCLFTVDPATGIATEVGPASVGDTQFRYLADCGGLLTSGQGKPGNFFDVSSSTGATSNPRPAPLLYGFDCAGDQRYALTFNPIVIDQAVPQEVGLDLSTFDPATGMPTLVASIDPGDADLNALAIPPAQQQPTTTTTAAVTTTTQAVSAVTAQPKFTG